MPPAQPAHGGEAWWRKRVSEREGREREVLESLRYRQPVAVADSSNDCTLVKTVAVVLVTAAAVYLVSPYVQMPTPV